jgi:hypothetical protein
MDHSIDGSFGANYFNVWTFGEQLSQIINSIIIVSEVMNQLSSSLTSDF